MGLLVVRIARAIEALPHIARGCRRLRREHSPESGAGEYLMAIDKALVLGGGGVAAVAWMTGLLTGLAEAGQDVTGADLVIGTSAGATVAAQLGSGLGLDELFARQADPARQAAEIMVDIDLAKYAGQFGEYLAGATSPEDTFRRIGSFALTAQTVPPAERLAVIESRLPSREWPARPIQLVAVDCESGQTRVFDGQSGVSLIDAVAASCAVPGIWPPVAIDGRRYMDGGVRSSDNADLAGGAGRIVVVSPFGSNSQLPSPMPLREVVARLVDGGAAVTVISPDEASAAAMGSNPLDPATRQPAAAAGRAQGRNGLAAAAAAAPEGGDVDGA
jgi:NTE family protein